MACLNSRPLYPLTDNPDEFVPLTPGHFLIGGPLNAVPEQYLLDIKVNLLTRWKMVPHVPTVLAEVVSGLFSLFIPAY